VRRLRNINFKKGGNEAESKLVFFQKQSLRNDCTYQPAGSTPLTKNYVFETNVD